MVFLIVLAQEALCETQMTNLWESRSRSTQVLEIPLRFPLTILLRQIPTSAALQKYC